MCQIQKFRYLIVLDFEATFPIKPLEIIEWPAKIIDTKNICILNNSFHHFIKPMINPILSDECMELTGIQQNTINKSNNIFYVIQKWNEFCYSNNLLPSNDQQQKQSNSCIVTCGNWDLKVMWRKQADIIYNCNLRQSQYVLTNWFKHCNILHIPSSIKDIIYSYNTDSLITSPALFHSWINIKQIFREYYNKRARGMKHILHALGIEHKGNHHSGIDDVSNICNIILCMLKDNVIFDYSYTDCNNMSIADDLKIKQLVYNGISLHFNCKKHINEITDNDVQQSDSSGFIKIGLITIIKKKKKIITIINGLNEEKLMINHNITLKKLSKKMAKQFATGVGLSKYNDKKSLMIQGDFRYHVADFLYSKLNISMNLLYYISGYDDATLKCCFSQKGKLLTAKYYDHCLALGQ